jgi:hypothetical protein
MRFVVLTAATLLAVMLYLVLHRPSLWRLPDWLDRSLLLWANGSGSVLFGLLFGLAWGAYKHELAPNLRALVLTAGLCEAALIANSAITQRFSGNLASDVKFHGQVLLQTSGSTCAPASGANVAGLLGFQYSERDMCRLMQTRISGTSPAAILRGMRAAGLDGMRFEVQPVRLDTIPLPAILLVDHPRAGPESHAVTAVRFHQKELLLEIWDPLVGRQMMTQADLEKIWRGRGLAFKKPSP